MRKLLVVGALAMLAAFALATRPGSDTPVVHAATPQVFNVGAANQVYNIPPGTTQLLIEARGGKGGQAANPPGIASCLTGALGGVGDQVTTIYTVTPGTTVLFVNVGGNGTVTAGGANGGGNAGTANTATLQGAGGGGGSDVRLNAALATRVVVAGGGGGGGGCGNQNGTFGGPGGNASAAGGNGGPVGQGGGGGGGAVGVAGGAAGAHFGTGAAPTAGALAAGGNGGNGNVVNITTQNGSGGGGGGGFAGGGGGGAGNPAGSGGGGGGGGGGSSFAGAGTAGTVIVPHPDGQASVGRVTITPIDPLTVTKSFNPASIQVNGTSIVGIVVTNGNAFPLTGIAFTDNLPAGVTINGALTTFGGNPLCTGASVTPPSTIRITAGTLAANSTCAIGVPVTSATAGTYFNPSFAVTTTEGVTSNSNQARLDVTALPVVPTLVPPSPIPPSPVPVIVAPVIPQVFQHVPQGIFYGNKNTPTPVVRAAVAAVVNPGAMPALRPPNTGNAGLKTQRGPGYAPLVLAGAAVVLSTALAWRLRTR